MQKKETKEEVNNEIIWLDTGIWVYPEFIEQERKIIKSFRDDFDRVLADCLAEIITEERTKRNK